MSYNLSPLSHSITLKEIFAADNFKIDEASLNYKLIDDQLYIQGLAAENEEVRTVGFRFGK